MPLFFVPHLQKKQADFGNVTINSFRYQYLTILVHQTVPGVLIGAALEKKKEPYVEHCSLIKKLFHPVNQQAGSVLAVAIW